MTSYNEQSHVNIGDLYTASMHNTLLDNVHALWTNAASGAMPYWNSASVMAALAKPASKALMTHTGTVPAWHGIGSEGQIFSVLSGSHAWIDLGFIHTIATVNNVGTSQSTSSGTAVDVTGASVNLTLTRTCKILVFGNATGYPNTGAGSFNIQFGLSINGTAVGNYQSYVPYPAGIAVAGYLGAVAAGTRNVKLQFFSPFSENVTSNGAYLVALAVPE